MKLSTLYVISWVIGILLLIVIVGLRLADKIKLKGVIFFSVFVLLLVGGANALFYFKKPKNDLNTSAKKVMSREQARETGEDLLMRYYAENPEEQILEDIVEMGRSNTPIYYRIVRGEFDKKLYGIVLNLMDSNRGGIEEYDDTKAVRDTIKQEILRRCNLAAFSPAPEAKLETTDSYDPLTGRRVIHSKPIASAAETTDKKEAKLE